jgi:hypothetical protein
MSDLPLGSISPINDFPSPDTPTWNNPSNLVDGKLPTAGYNPPNKPVADYPANAREFPKKVSPLELWYRGSEPPGCVISGGVVTSDNKQVDQST